MVIIPFTLPYKWVCSERKLGDIYWQPSNGLYFVICVKLLQHALLIFTSISQLRLLWSITHFPCQNSLVVSLVQTPIRGFYGKYSSEKMFMIELLGDLKVFGIFHWSPIGELVGYNEKFQPQGVVEVVREIVKDFSCAWTFLGFAFINIFCILYVVHYFYM